MSNNNLAASPEVIETQKAAAPSTRRVVVILGSGRSGTSLCAKVLSRLGVAIEDTLQKPNDMNPDGYFEDSRIVDINKRLLEKLAPVSGAAPSTKFPDSRIEPEIRDLKEHLKERSQSTTGLWGFKDPRASMLLPIYRRIFQSEGIVPIYIFCARSADAVVESFQQTGLKSREICEQIYFLRTFLSLRDSAANCYVLHYERLLEDPAARIKSIWSYINSSDKDFPLNNKQCVEIVDQNLNRSVLRATAVENPLAIRMDKLIHEMDGSNFDRSKVFEELREIDTTHAGYQSWVNRAADLIHKLKLEASLDKKIPDYNDRLNRVIKQRDEAEHRAEEGDKRIEILISQLGESEVKIKNQDEYTSILVAELSKLQAEKANLDKERNSAIARVRSSEGELQLLRKKSGMNLGVNPSNLEQNEGRLQKENMKLRKKLAVREEELATMTAQLEFANLEIKRIVMSVRHRAGTLLVDAVRTPGWKVFALPWRLARLRSKKSAERASN